MSVAGPSWRCSCGHAAALASAAVPWVAVLLLGSASRALAVPRSARPCSDADWDFAFTECLPDGTGRRRSRDVFAFGPPEVCNATAPSSLPLPKPLLGVPCQHPCPKGTRLAPRAEVQQAGGEAQVTLKCQDCDPGRFSLGGGMLLDGADGDWGSQRPAQMTSFCFYRASDYEWYNGGSQPKRCVLHLGEDISAQTRSGKWNTLLPDVELDVPLVVPPGDPTVCEPIAGDSVRGKAVLVSRGMCTFALKTELLDAAGAVAVVLYNNEAYEKYFIPASANESAPPQIPIFMITLEDGQRFLEPLPAAGEAEGTDPLMLRVASTHCNESNLEVLPTTPSGNRNSNNSAEFLRQHNWGDMRDGSRGCNAWTADAGGGFLHSGNNLHFHWIYSVLSLSVRFARDGHLRFRYSVSSEEGRDGLSFLMDEAEQFSKTSLEAPYKEYKVEVPRGSHTFTWVYAKDYSSTMNEDVARLQFLEVVGSDYSDQHCRKCGRARERGSFGAESCPFCGRDFYLLPNATCAPCPPGHGAAPGALACKPRRACTRLDMEVKYSAYEMNGTVPVPIASGLCRQGKTLAVWSWRQPVLCDPARPESVELPADSGEVHECPQCQPYEQRLSGSGGACTPTTTTCPKGLFSMRELVVAHWYTWPRGFSNEVVAHDGGLLGRAGGHDRCRWSLAPDAASASVGSAFGGLDETEVGASIAKLHLDATFLSVGNLSFYFEARPAGAWGRAAQLLVNGSSASGAELTGPFGRFPLWRVVLPLAPGYHRITWSWQFGEALESNEDGNPEREGARGLRLINISAQNVAGAGSSGCQPCPAGSEVVPDGGVCRECPSGRASPGGPGAICKACASGTAALSGEAMCTPCGPGLVSDAGAARCEPLTSLTHNVSDTGREFDLQKLASAWRGNGSDQGLRPLRAEGHLYYLALFGAFPGPLGGVEWGRRAEAYWWERLPPRASVSTPPGVAAGSGAAVCEVGSGLAGYRIVGETLERLEVVSDANVTGVRAVFAGNCEGVPRRASLLLRCDLQESSGDVLGLVTTMLDVDSRPASQGAPSHTASFRQRPASPRSCDDFEIEWRSPAACPTCRAEDYLPVEMPFCDPEKGRLVTYVRLEQCYDESPPKDSYVPCVPGGSRRATGLMFIVVPAALVLLCISCYVLLLRRRYAKYMVLEADRDRPADVVTGSPIGAPAASYS